MLLELLPCGLHYVFPQYKDLSKHARKMEEDDLNPTKSFVNSTTVLRRHYPTQSFAFYNDYMEAICLGLEGYFYHLYEISSQICHAHPYQHALQLDGLVPGPLSDTKPCKCSSPLYRMAQHVCI